MKEHQPGGHDQSTHGHGGGVGSLSGVDVSKWKATNSAAKWAPPGVEDDAAEAPNEAEAPVRESITARHEALRRAWKDYP